MEAYSNRKPLLHEAHTESSVSYFPWFYGRNLVPTPKFYSDSHQLARCSPEHAISVHPICSIAPTTESNKDGKQASTSKISKFSWKDLNETSSEVVKRKQSMKRKKKSNLRKAEGQTTPGERKIRKDLEIVNAITNFDISMVPTPYCSCTGVSRACHKWGGGSWQSSCCTNSISQYPLPARSSRPGSRISGRKMTHGAYVKLLLKLAAEGHDLTRAVDLKDHWARIGTNQFVTIK